MLRCKSKKIDIHIDLEESDSNVSRFIFFNDDEVKISYLLFVGETSIFLKSLS